MSSLAEDLFPDTYWGIPDHAKDAIRQQTLLWQQEKDSGSDNGHTVSKEESVITSFGPLSNESPSKLT